jgi:hypothetical protein
VIVLLATAGVAVAGSTVIAGWQLIMAATEIDKAAQPIPVADLGPGVRRPRRFVRSILVGHGLLVFGLAACLPAGGGAAVGGLGVGADRMLPERVGDLAEVTRWAPSVGMLGALLTAMTVLITYRPGGRAVAGTPAPGRLMERISRPARAQTAAIADRLAEIERLSGEYRDGQKAVRRTPVDAALPLVLHLPPNTLRTRVESAVGLLDPGRDDRAQAALRANLNRTLLRSLVEQYGPDTKAISYAGVLRLVYDLGGQELLDRVVGAPPEPALAPGDGGSEDPPAEPEVIQLPGSGARTGHRPGEL